MLNGVYSRWAPQQLSSFVRENRINPSGLRPKTLPLAKTPKAMQTAAGVLSFSSLLLSPFKPLKPSDPFFNGNPKTLTPIFRPGPKHNNTNHTRNPIQAGSKAKTSKNPKRKPSRRSSIRKSFSQEQLIFNAPVSDDPLVAIIGGGMSGLLCALGLEKRGIRSTVFDSVRSFVLLSIS